LTGRSAESLKIERLGAEEVRVHRGSRVTVAMEVLDVVRLAVAAARERDREPGVRVSPIRAAASEVGLDR